LAELLQVMRLLVCAALLFGSAAAAQDVSAFSEQAQRCREKTAEAEMIQASLPSAQPMDPTTAWQDMRSHCARTQPARSEP
jgi:hypothetical protein